MAKAQRLYSGSDSYGRRIEVAQSVFGPWFWREYSWNGYGVTWSKWQDYNKTPVHPEKVRFVTECANAPEFFEIPEEERENRIEWGFNVLRIVPGPHRVRLPN